MQTKDSVSLICLTKYTSMTYLNAYDLPMSLSTSLAKWIEGGSANEMLQYS